MQADWLFTPLEAIVIAAVCFTIGAFAAWELFKDIRRKHKGFVLHFTSK